MRDTQLFIVTYIQHCLHVLAAGTGVELFKVVGLVASAATAVSILAELMNDLDARYL